MKKEAIVILSVLTLSALLAGCQARGSGSAEGGSEQTVKRGTDEEGVIIVTSQGETMQKQESCDQTEDSFIPAQAATEDSTNNSEMQNSQSASDGLSALQLNLPKQYTIQYRVSNSEDWEDGYTQTLTRTAEGYYMEFGDSGERYVFECLENGKYIQYEYDEEQGTYEPTMLTEDIQKLIDAGVMTLDMVSLDSNVVSGYASRMTVIFDFYSSFAPSMTLAGEEEIEGISCLHYTVSSEEMWGRQTTDVWADPETGLCMKAVYLYQPPEGSVSVRQLECSQFETENVTLPEYR